MDRGIRTVVAVNALSVGGLADGTGAPVYKAFLSVGCWILKDSCCPLELLDAGSSYIFAFPLLMRGCGSALTRAVALVD